MELSVKLCQEKNIARQSLKLERFSFQATKISLIKPPMSENILTKLTGLTISLVTIFLKWRENIWKYRTRLFQLLKDTKHTQTTVYKVKRSEILIGVETNATPTYECRKRARHRREGPENRLSDTQGLGRNNIP